MLICSPGSVGYIMIIGVENLMKIEYDIKDLLCRACLRSAKFSAITIVRLLALNRRTWFILQELLVSVK